MDKNIDKELETNRIEGRNPVAEALAAGRSINRAFILEQATGELAALAGRLREEGAIVQFVSRASLDAMATSRAHQGIIVEAAAYQYSDLDTVLADCRDRGQEPFILLLDQIQDAHNLGSILRIADGAGAHAVVILKRRSVPLNAAVAKASAGAIEHVPVCRVNNLTSVILMLKEAGFWIFGTRAGDGLNYREADYSGKIALVIGSEGQGISKKVAEHCDFHLSIPLHGRVNSLNAAVACGIIAFEAAASRRGQETPAQA